MHGQDLAKGYGAVYLPDALAQGSPRRSGMGLAIRLPGQLPVPNPRSGITRRHHLNESSLQKAIKEADRLAGIVKPVGLHILCHCFETHLLETRYGSHTVQELLGHKDVETTMIYTHACTERSERVLNRGRRL